MKKKCQMLFFQITFDFENNNKKTILLKKEIKGKQKQHFTNKLFIKSI